MVTPCARTIIGSSRTQNAAKQRSLVIITSLLVNRQIGANMLGNSFGWGRSHGALPSKLTILEGSTLCTLSMRRASLHLLSGTNRVCGIADDFISRLEITEHFYVSAHTQTGDHIHPFRLPIVYALDEGTLLIIGYSGDRHKHRWSTAMDRPFHTAVTARR